jgi:NAD(P)-dependent dehydrogenase (short-subunit alcohol dehydrogenase family)
VREVGGDVTPYACDVTASQAIAGLVAACTKRYGGIDILVNKVGGPALGAPVRLSEEDWRKQIDINLTSVFLMCKQVIPVMEAKGGGSIVNIASTSGIRWTGSPAVGYAAAKAGVIQFGRVAAVEYATKRIRVNSVVPGQLHTPLVDAVLAKDQSGGDIESLLSNAGKRASRCPSWATAATPQTRRCSWRRMKRAS